MSASAAARGPPLRLRGRRNSSGRRRGWPQRGHWPTDGPVMALGLAVTTAAAAPASGHDVRVTGNCQWRSNGPWVQFQVAVHCQCPGPGHCQGQTCQTRGDRPWVHASELAPCAAGRRQVTLQRFEADSHWHRQNAAFCSEVLPARCCTVSGFKSSPSTPCRFRSPDGVDPLRSWPLQQLPNGARAAPRSFRPRSVPGQRAHRQR